MAINKRKFFTFYSLKLENSLIPILSLGLQTRQQLDTFHINDNYHYNEVENYPLDICIKNINIKLLEPLRDESFFRAIPLFSRICKLCPNIFPEKVDQILQWNIFLYSIFNDEFKSVFRIELSILVFMEFLFV